MKKYNLKNDTMNESELKKAYCYPLYPRSCKMYSDKVFVNIDNGTMGGIHWTCFIIKHNKSYYYDSFGASPDKFLLNQLPKPIIHHNCKIEGINSKFCGSYSLNFFY